MKTNLNKSEILFHYKNHTIKQNELGDIEVINPLGDKFYIRLDDSKDKGYKFLVDMSFEEQLKSSIEYIDWVSVNRKTIN